MSELLKTNSKQYTNKLHKFLLDNIYFEDLGEIQISDNQKIDYLFATFEGEFNCEYNKRIWPNNQERLANWLMGLPSCINIPFSYCDILELAKELHNVKDLTTKQEDKICENYFAHIALHLLKIKTKLTKK